MPRADGMTYAPQGKPAPVCRPEDFPFAAVGLDHPHINTQCQGLTEAGGQLRWVYDPDPVKVQDFCQRHPGVKVARHLDEVLNDPAVLLVTAASVPCDRGPLGCQVMRAGKDYFVDKGPFTTFDQLAEARRVVAQTNRKYLVYYGERLHNEASFHAGELVRQGAIGRVIHTAAFGPHRLHGHARPDWFYQLDRYGGVICDIGSHQCEQFLYYTEAEDAKINYSAVGNYGHPEHPGLEDFGEASLTADNGSSGYFRVDWFTPAGLRVWGDGRMIVLGTNGYIEVRKYIDVTADPVIAGQVILVDGQREYRIDCRDKVGYPFFGRLILDCLHRTENAMTQKHIFKTAELTLQAQAQAVRLTP